MNHGVLLGRKYTTTTTTGLVFKMQTVIDWLPLSTQSPHSKLPLWHFQPLSAEKPWPRQREEPAYSCPPPQTVTPWDHCSWYTYGLFVVSPEDKSCSQKNQGTLKLLLSWEGDQLISIKDVTLMVYIQKSHQRGDIKCIYIFTTKLQVFKTNSEQCRASGKTDVENLGYLLASDVDSAGESFLWVVL